MTKHRIFTTSVASVYPHYVAKAERKGRTKAEVDEIIRWLTGHSQETLDAELTDKTSFEDFFAHAPITIFDYRRRMRRPRGGDSGANDARDTLPR